MRIGITFNVRTADTAHCASAPAVGNLALPRDDGDEEFDSPETIGAMADAVRSLGHDVELLGYGIPLVRRLVQGNHPDLVWNIAEGAGGSRSREARVPALLEMLDIPYTGSDPLTLAATLDKDCAKRLVASAGLATPRWTLATPELGADACSEMVRSFDFPLFVKPAWEGSSKGILPACIIEDTSQLPSALEELWDAYAQSVLVEEFIEGDELTVGLVGNGIPDVLGIMRVVPRQLGDRPFIYSLDVKRDYLNRVDYECPAPLSAKDTAAVTAAALACWQVLGCRDVARIDFRLRSGIPYFLEANPLPGLSPRSGDLCIMAGLLGIEYPDLIGRIIQSASQRLGLACETSIAR